MTENSKKKIADHYARLFAEATKEWESVRHGDLPFILVGTATCGQASGSLDTFQTFAAELKKHHLAAHLIPVGCMGHCYAEPLVVIGKPGFPPILYGNVAPAVATTLVQHFLKDDNPLPELMFAALEPNDMLPSLADFPRFALESRAVLRYFGHIDPESINQYLAQGGYRALSTALQCEPEQIVDRLIHSGLRGMGGAGYPTGKKWESCRQAPGPIKYVICNGDEGDPGSFSDRAVMESSPHQVLEGLIIAGYTIGAHCGTVYLRSEYPLAAARMATAVQKAREAGLLGSNILDSGFSFDIELFQGSGAFVCGEETALIQSLEGNRGMPRQRPPYPAQQGFKEAPTLIDNVKTLANVPLIMADTDAQPAAQPRTAIFAVAGKVNNVGLVEVAIGTPLRTIVFDLCGGIPKRKAFKAVQIGGPSGGCLPAAALDTPVDFESLHDWGAMMGSGGLVVLDEDDCMVEVARYFLDFTQKESCGKCTFCRIGTRHLLSILEGFTRGEGSPADIDLLVELAEDIQRGSLCGLGKTAPNPVLTALKYFRDEYEAHINQQCCPAKMCRHLTAFYIIPEKCERSCDACVGSCPTEAIYTAKHRVKAIDQEKCVKCGACLDACPPQYNAITRYSPAHTVPPAAEKQ